MDLNTLRIAFLVALIVTLVLYRLRFPGPGLPWLFEVLTNLLVLGGGLLTTALFFTILFRVDPFPYIRQAAYFIGFQQLVVFDTAIPVNLADNLAVTKVERADTDGDGFNEWVVFYKFDKRASLSPIQGVVYDNDRGNPPVIFPYSLRAPDRNYLSEGDLNLELAVAQVASDQNGPGGTDIEEIVVEGDNTLTIFRFNQNSEIWDFPRDAPPRYQAIGFFRGSGEVALDQQTRQVTVVDRDGYERSQLALRSVYGLRVDPLTNAETYLDPIQPLGGEGTPKLAAPIVSTIDFYPSPPDDIFHTPFPEKVVLGFYAATCAGANETLCNNFNANWDLRSFLAGDALSAFDNGNAAYFGLPAVRGVAEISVSQLRYYPQTETDPDLLVTGQGRDVVTGEEAQVGLVEVVLTANGSSLQTVRYEVRRIEGQWKIWRTLPLPDERRILAVCPAGINPIANPRQTTVGQNITFSVDFSGGFVPDALTQPQWDLGDTSAEGGLTVAHSYGNTGSYNAIFRAQSISGQEIVCSVPIEITDNNQPPTAEANGPYSALVCQPVIFSSAGSNDPDGAITGYQWNFGDGSPTAADQNPTHVYPSPGVFTITLTVTDNAGQSSQDTTTVRVGIPVPPPPKCPPAACCG